ncbi:MAG: bi-domain-containing oxidoreductase [Alphaproteobacteria bacterium]
MPKNLVVKIPDLVSDEDAAFATLSAIAMQGVRLAEPQLGETFLVLGLGLIGQLTVQLLRANGCNVIGTDLDASLVELAEQFGAVGISGEAVNACLELTGGHGVDGVLVCAGTASNQPIELCGEVTREKGRVVVVGAVRMDIPREDYFKKEIDIVISRSYGPGRYDPLYEQGGNDYPYGYVRFTEQRNMTAFLGLVAQKKLDVGKLISHRFPLARAAEAYALIQGAKTEPYLGIILQYAEHDADTAAGPRRITVSSQPLGKDRIGVSFFGAGNYATASLLPPLQATDTVAFRGLVTASGRTAQGVAKQFGFDFCATGFSELLDHDTDAIMVTSRHDTHASSVIAALRAKKHVYVEKPLAMTVEELAAIQDAHADGGAGQLMIGLNRRFTPLTRMAMEHFVAVQSPLVINVRVNAGAIPADHWIQDPVMGGGRMIGEGCHFVDLAAAICNSNPATVYAVGTAKPNKTPMLNDNLSVALTFENGAIANIIYTADGSNAMAKEYVEIFGGGRSAVIDDFKELRLHAGDHQTKRTKLVAQDKGQKAMLAAWLEGLRTARPAIPFDNLLATSLATIMAIESLSIGMPLAVKLPVSEPHE